jgi:hypothetical protein
MLEIVGPSDSSLVDATVAQPKDEALILFTFICSDALDAPILPTGTRRSNSDCRMPRQGWPTAVQKTVVFRHV